MRTPEFEAARAMIESAPRAELFAIIGDLAELTARAQARVFSDAASISGVEAGRLERMEKALVEMREPTSSEMVTEAEAARMRRKTVHALRKERKREAGPPWVRDGRRVLYPKVELMAWLAEREHETRDSRQRPHLPRAVRD